MRIRKIYGEGSKDIALRLTPEAWAIIRSDMRKYRKSANHVIGHHIIDRFNLLNDGMLFNEFPLEEDE